MTHIRHWVFPSHVCPTIYDCSKVSTSTHLTGPWHALLAPECVVCVCHTSSLLWMWYAQVWFQAVRTISIPYLNRLVSPECLWNTLKLCWGVYHTSNPLCSTEVCCRFLSCDAVSPAIVPCGIRGGSRRHIAFTGLSSAQNCPSGKDLRQYLLY